MLNQSNLKEILTKYRTVAIVGVSRYVSKDSYRVAEYLKKQGFYIVPINPFADEVLGEKSYGSLLDIPTEFQETIKIVDIFRPFDYAPSIVEQSIQLKKLHDVLEVVWMQLGIVNEQAAEKARNAGLTAVMDKCIIREHQRLFGIQ
ncbi:MAG: CoA-binding protein [Candidatus Bathyarchaeota archaeon]|nr:MAG: CoA-binding protein [Candidatus Bathyarchaeota archaeon]